MPRYFEDFTAGSVEESGGRTITEADIVHFAGLSGDFVPLHMDEEYARQSPFGRRIAHGALIFSISTGLMTQSSDIHRTVLAFYGVNRLRFRKPVFIGDTIRVRKTVLGVEQRHQDRGLVTFETQVLNQAGEAVLVYEDVLLIRTRPPG
ncbi:MAG: dehydratase [Acidobacteria bacterium]|nr:dehydratase [Acidobacteriota bacterium]